MTENTLKISIPTTITAAVLVISSFSDYNTLPHENYSSDILKSGEKAWEEHYLPQYNYDYFSDLEKMNFIHQFASTLLQESEDIPAEFAEVLNDNFGDII